jgi:putative ABC transport system permease protein
MRMDDFLHDLKFSLRLYRKNAGFTVIAVLTLGLGIGASTAVFSVVNGILLKPLPYPAFEKIVIPWRMAPAGLNLGYDEIPWGLDEFKVFSNNTKVFKELAAFKSDSFNLTGSGDPVLIQGIRASAEFFPVLGVQPILGRTFAPAEDQAGHELEVVLSFQLWNTKFRGDPAILGKAINLDGKSYRVIGVMPSGFSFPRGEEMPGSFAFPQEQHLWVPLALPPAKLTPDDPDDLAVIAKLDPGVTLQEAQADMDVLGKNLEAAHPRLKGWFNSRVTLLAHQVAGDTRRPLLLLLGAVGIVLLIACSNVANLLLAKSIGRMREFKLRTALGAAFQRLVRQLLTESLVLASVGALVGMLLAQVSVHFVKVFGPSSIPRIYDINIDWRVFVFSLSITLIAGVFFAVAPAVGFGRGDLAASLKEGGQRTIGSSASPRLRGVLVISEVALAVVLVIAAALLVQTFYHLLGVDPGFVATRVLTFELALPSIKYPDQKRIVSLYHQMLQQLPNLPGVRSVGLVYTVPMGGAPQSTGIRIPDHPITNGKEKRFAAYTIASPGYFATVGTPLLQGRDFLESDTAESQPVAMINDAMARKYWPGENPVGKQVMLGSPRYPPMTIIGIVANVKYLSLREEPGPEMYVPYTQKPWPSMLTMQMVIRTQANPSSATDGVRGVLHSLDPDLPMANVTSLTKVVEQSIAVPRFSMLLLGSFGFLAVVLASIGLYGVISHSVSQRTQEIGIRMALGASRAHVFGMILSEGTRLTVLGVAVGVGAALIVTRMMVSFLYEVRPNDPWTFIAVSVCLVGVALLASYIPARRAASADPMNALRYE